MIPPVAKRQRTKKMMPPISPSELLEFPDVIFWSHTPNNVKAAAKNAKIVSKCMKNLKQVFLV